ncbi:MAG: hypothetical protein F6K47_23730 [Symploca sp. SIO2E6]|nr:hypothetical protein [Symploca sp. SIO2E6]
MDNQKMGNYSRKLAPLEEEYGLYYTKLEGLGLVASVMRLRGSLEIPVIEQSLSLLQQRHPFLQMQIVQEKDGMYFAAQATRRIPLRIVKRNKENQWLEVLEEELNYKIDIQQDPLIKLAYIPAASGSDVFDLIFFIHHSISDGICLVQLCREFLDYCARITEGEQVKVDRLPLSPPSEELLPLSKNVSLKFFLFKLKFICEQLLKKPHQLAPDIDSPVSEQKSRLVHRFLNERQTKRLCQICKKEGTTVTAALNTAMVLTLKNELAIPGDAYINAIIAVNNRQFIPSEFAHHKNLSFMAGGIWIFENIFNKASFWERARNSRQKIEQGLRSNHHFYSVLAAPYRIDILKKGEILPTTYILSNVGRINQPKNYGCLELIENHITASNRSYKPLPILHCTTFNSKLYLTFSYAEPLISKKKAQSMVDFLMSSLLEAIGEFRIEN